jgi:hypothetical protein
MPHLENKAAPGGNPPSSRHDGPAAAHQMRTRHQRGTAPRGFRMVKAGYELAHGFIHRE